MIAKGQKINDRYEIVKNIGEGGMANVFLASDTILNRNVAIKILRGDLSNDDKFVRRFQREALSASSLDHLNVVKMYDVGEDDGNYYIVMEYVNGLTLKKLIKKRGALSVPEAIDIMLQLTSGLAHAHDAYIIHRDIKPQNILIMDDGLVKITDFGIAMAMNSTQLTQTNSVMGSVHYLPPEQATGTGSTIKSDIYSLGILLYELLSGKIPFKGENAVEIALKQLRDEIPSIRKFDSKIPQCVENVIIKATAKNPKNRYKDAHQMNEDLKTILNEERKEEEKHVYEYPEQDLEITKKFNPISDVEKDKKISKKMKKNNSDIINKVLLSLGIILTLLVIGATAIFLFGPSLVGTKEFEIPDVSGMTEQTAEKALKDLNFEIAEDYLFINDEEIKKDLIVKSLPSSGLYRKEGTVVTLYKSIGSKKVVLEDYAGKSYSEVKSDLEAMDLIVLIEKITTEEDIVENTIIRQEPGVGINLSPGDTITLYIPEKITTYPDMVTEDWSVADVEAFATQYELILSIDYETSEEQSVGTIIYQNRSPKTVIVEGTNLKITVVKETEVVDDEE